MCSLSQPTQGTCPMLSGALDRLTFILSLSVGLSFCKCVQVKFL